MSQSECCVQAHTCAQREAGLLAHIAQADGDAVSSSGLQAFQQVLHSVVLSGQLVVTLHLPDPIPHMDHICLKIQEVTQRGPLLTTSRFKCC